MNNVIVVETSLIYNPLEGCWDHYETVAEESPQSEATYDLHVWHTDSWEEPQSGLIKYSSSIVGSKVDAVDWTADLIVRWLRQNRIPRVYDLKDLMFEDVFGKEDVVEIDEPYTDEDAWFDSQPNTGLKVETDFVGQRIDEDLPF